MKAFLRSTSTYRAPPIASVTLLYSNIRQMVFGISRITLALLRPLLQGAEEARVSSKDCVK